MQAHALGKLVTYISIIATVWIWGPITAHAAERQMLHGHVPSAIARLTPEGRLQSAQHLKLAIGLPLRNQQALSSLLNQLYDPTSPNYRQYLTPAQFTERFGPTAQDYQAVVTFAKANGLAVTALHPNRLIVDVEGTVSDIEKTFHVRMWSYQHPKESRKFYAPDGEPSIDLSIPILNISGLDNYSLPHPNYHLAPAGLLSTTSSSGSGPGGLYGGNDFRAAYVPGTTLTGAGQSVGILAFDGYYSSDIAAYRAQFGLPNIPLIDVAVDGGNTPGIYNLETCIDIDMVTAMAPGLSAIYVYESPNFISLWVDILSRMANDNLAKQLSCSWSGGGPNPTAEAVFQQMAAQGQSFFNATGDVDAFTGAILFPSDSPNITEVGGTTLTTTGPGGSYVSETVWNWGGPPGGGGTGSSGGVSTYYSIPIWQQNVNMTVNQGSTTMRNVPDVALTADNIYIVYNNGSSGASGGTSCAAPLWAAFTALANQQAAANGRPSVGFLNPTIYALGESSNYTFDFHDTTTGNNFFSFSPTKFAAVTGYDLCTGWGSPNGTALINALAGTPNTGTSKIIYYQDSFSRSGELNGSTPDIANTGGNHWTVSTGPGAYATNGGAVYDRNVAYDAAYLPVNGSSGVTLDGTKNFTLSATLTPDSTGQWYGIALNTSTISAGGNVSTNNLAMLTLGNTYAGAFHGDINLTYGYNGYAAGNPYSVSLFYNALTGTITYTAGGSVIYALSGITASQISSLRAVSLGNGYSSTSATADNFALVVANSVQTVTSVQFPQYYAGTIVEPMNANNNTGGVISVQNWNVANANTGTSPASNASLVNSNGSPLGSNILINSTGSNTAITFTYSGYTTNDGSNNSGFPNPIWYVPGGLADLYIAEGSSFNLTGTPETLVVSGLNPNHTYSLIVYVTSPWWANGDTGSELASVSLGGMTYYVKTSNALGTWTQATSMTSGLPTTGNYVKFSNLTGSTSQTVTLTGAYTGFAGFQIIDLGSCTNLIGDGIYEIAAQNSNLALAANGIVNGSAVSQQTYTAANAQKWNLANLGGNVVSLTAYGTNEALEVPGSSTTPGINLDVSAYTGGTNQQWTIVSTGSGYYEVVNVNSGYEANVTYNSTLAGGLICQWFAGNYSNGVWSFTSVGATP